MNMYPNVYQETMLVKRIHELIKHGNDVGVKETLSRLTPETRKCTVNRHLNGRTALSEACILLSSSTLEFLIKHCSANVNQRSSYLYGDDGKPSRVTTLWIACAHLVTEQEQKVRVLVECGADLNARDEHGTTPFQIACCRNRLTVAKYLLRSGVEINQVNIHGVSALMYAVKHLNVCKFLVKNGADVNMSSKDGKIVLHYAIEKRSMKCMKYFIENGASILVRDNDGNDSLQHAVLCMERDVVNYLLGLRCVPLLRKIETYELLGSVYAKRSCYKDAIDLWSKSMTLRLQTNNLIANQETETDDIFGNFSGPKTLEEMTQIITTPKDFLIQSILFNERILGPNHKETLLFYFQYAKLLLYDGEYNKCLRICKKMYAICHSKYEPLAYINTIALSVLKECYIYMYNENVEGAQQSEKFSDEILHLFELTISHLVKFKGSATLIKSTSEEYRGSAKLCENIIDLLNLIENLHLVSKQSQTVNVKLQELALVNPTDRNGKTLLHLAVSRVRYIARWWSISHFYPLPSKNVLKLLLNNGFSILAQDSDGNTPLHSYLSYVDKHELNDNGIVDILMKHGGHLDARSSEGDTVLDLLEKKGILDYSREPLPLVCIASVCICENNLPFEIFIPNCLSDFVKMH